MRLFGLTLIGATPTNLHKLVLTIAFVAGAAALTWALRLLLGLFIGTRWRMTDNWLELTVRFLLPDHGGRGIKDAMSRKILSGLNKAKIGIASGTYAIVEMPPIRIETAGQPA